MLLDLHVVCRILGVENYITSVVVRAMLPAMGVVIKQMLVGILPILVMRLIDVPTQVQHVHLDGVLLGSALQHADRVHGPEHVIVVVKITVL